uniref:Uncharacterized protein n=1 Tax=Anopheles merus TaxID=30066 RepID=A0A182UVG7_ANOME
MRAAALAQRNQREGRLEERVPGFMLAIHAIRDDVALVEAAGPFTSSSLSSLAGHSNQATVAGLLLSEVADHCQLLLAHEALACRPSHIATGDAGSAAPCTKSSINEAYYNLDKVFA